MANAALGYALWMWKAVFVFTDEEGDCGVVGPCGGNGFGGLLEWGFGKSG